jgi:dTDP-4-dehydrorhamnose reductase
MRKKRVVVLGGSGMLGSMLVDWLAQDESLHVTATVRSSGWIEKGMSRIEGVDWRLFELGNETAMKLQLQALGPTDWVINAIGLTKPYAHDDNGEEIQQAILGNASFPYLLGRIFKERGGRILQIATDCVYSGQKGDYVEGDLHDALDVYGKTKSLGEALLPNVHCLRCSIIGPEPKSFVFLLEWFRRQQLNSKLSGFRNHWWNGVTTLHFAKLCHAIILNDPDLPHLQHVVPTARVSKYNLLCAFAEVYSRPDLEIAATDASHAVNRTLATGNSSLNLKLWKMAGYETRPPTCEEMVAELSAFKYRFAELPQ